MRRVLIPSLVAAAVASFLVLPTWLVAAPSAQLSPPARTQPTAVLVPWDGSSAPDGLGTDVWCTGDAASGGCRAFNSDDHAIVAWAHTNLIEPYLAGQVTPTATPTAVALACATDTTVQGLTVLVSATCDPPTTVLVDVEVYALNGMLVHQSYKDAQSLATTPSSLTFQLPTLDPGEYVVKVGIFSAGWGTLYLWDDDAATLSVTAAATPTAVPSSTPTVIATATAQPTPTATPLPRPCQVRVRVGDEERWQNKGPAFCTDEGV